MMTALDFVQSLQQMKKTRDHWMGLGLEDRALALRKIANTINQMENELATEMARVQKLSADFILENEVRPSARSFLESAEKSFCQSLRPKPTGLLSILLPSFFSFRILTERLAPALLAGNGVFVFIPEENSSFLRLWQQLFDEALPVRLMTGAEDLEQVMAAHPSVQGVSFYGSPERAQKIYRQALSGSWKKWQITSGFHNSALVLNDADIPLAARQLADSCFTGMGQLHWNVSTIYVTEAMRPQFQAEFLAVLGERPKTGISDFTAQRNEMLIQQFRNENGKILFGGKVGEPMVIEDLSHCSTLQQDCLAAPIVLISPVKYTHEMIKWANTSYYGMFAQIFGPLEKIEKFAGQLDVSRVSANSWISSMKTLPMGLKQSFFGIPDLDPFGAFFSDIRNIDGLESKK